MKPRSYNDLRAEGWALSNRRREADTIARRVDSLKENAMTHGDDEWIAARMVSVLTDRRWLTKSGNYVYPEDMGTEHIVNTVRMINEGRMLRSGCSGRSNTEWLDIFVTELNRRGMAHKLIGTKVPI